MLIVILHPWNGDKMNKDVAFKLKEKAEEVARNFSVPDRACNTNKETFSVDKITSLGDDLATVTFKKSSGKKALALFLYVRGMGYWTYLFPTASHFLGMPKAQEQYLQIEEENYEKNFQPLTLDQVV